MLDLTLQGAQGGETVKPGRWAPPPSHLAYCIERGAVTLLDIRRDRYFGLPPALEATFVDLAAGGFWISSSSPQIGRLVALGLLAEGPAPSTTPIPPVCTGWLDDAPIVRASPRNILAAGRAVLDARLLQTRGFASVIESLRARRSGAMAPDLGRLRDEVCAFQAGRPWIPVKPVCLLDSLALLKFLEARSLSSTLVFGVIRRPFAAHCWLQVDDIVINDHLDHVREYQPLLAV
ncbi:hypothetical protein CFHF_24300 [Caulobacter flavus]|jgi:hypothetical protein|uniref:Microcin J25-processing protein McjB C-terminal domain-containing protein n=1 Tax=Caulobacter flavus TaxID=1679497 RepID=A0A2N5CLV2_9CAUL|nr:lasso peptide biosynthesis B2 protein [Caulobacter flavus]PLR06785.1 hypothetical protein CFHF_24300 [Caulobacter flavus]